MLNIKARGAFCPHRPPFPYGGKASGSMSSSVCPPGSCTRFGVVAVSSSFDMARRYPTKPPYFIKLCLIFNLLCLGTKYFTYNAHFPFLYNIFSVNKYIKLYSKSLYLSYIFVNYRRQLLTVFISVKAFWLFVSSSADFIVLSRLSFNIERCCQPTRARNRFRE